MTESRPAHSPPHRIDSLALAEEKMTTMTPVAVPDLDDIDIAIVNLIAACVASRGYPPTVREICREVGLSSPSSVHGRLRKLERAGCIKRTDKHSRAITLVSACDTECPAA
jgi:SOS-response transcriptional repressor LexA